MIDRLRHTSPRILTHRMHHPLKIHHWMDRPNPRSILQKKGEALRR